MHVAEKNSVAAKLAPFLCSRNTSPRGRGNALYKTCDFKGEWLDKGEVNHVMTAVRGHLLAHDFTGKVKSWHGCDPITCLDQNEGVITEYCEDDMNNVKQNLIDIAKKSHLLVIWTDCDREGEHIGFEIQSVCQKAKASLKCVRAQFSCCTKGEVAKAVRTLRPLHMGMVHAVQARMEIDLRVGEFSSYFYSPHIQHTDCARTLDCELNCILFLFFSQVQHLLDFKPCCCKINILI